MNCLAQGLSHACMLCRKNPHKISELNLKTKVEAICDVVHAGIGYVPSMNQICLGKAAMFLEGRAVTST